jgi:hypothetical protein
VCVNKVSKGEAEKESSRHIVPMPCAELEWHVPPCFGVRTGRSYSLKNFHREREGM